MKQNLSPRVIAAVVAAVVVIAGVIGWKLTTRPRQAHIVFGKGGDDLPPFVQSRKRFGEEMLRTGRSPDAYTSPSIPVSR